MATIDDVLNHLNTEANILEAKANSIRGLLETIRMVRPIFRDIVASERAKVIQTLRRRHECAEANCPLNQWQD